MLVTSAGVPVFFGPAGIGARPKFTLAVWYPVVAHGPFISMAAFWAVNKLSASAPVMFLGAIPPWTTSWHPWSTAPTVPADDSIDLVASALVPPPPFSHISTGHMG